MMKKEANLNKRIFVIFTIIGLFAALISSAFAATFNSDHILKQSAAVGDEYLKNTIYIESMNKYNYEPLRYDISKGHILLTYEIGAGDGWNHPHLVFEYNYETNTLEYKMLVFPYDSVPIEIVYIK